MSIKQRTYVSKSNRRGVVLLLFILLLIVFLPRLLAFISPEPPLQLSSEELLIAQHLEERSNSKKKASFKQDKPRKYRAPDKAFDPNSYRLQDWVELGLSPKQAEVIVKFSQRGIRSQEDFERIKVIPSELKQLIRDSLIFPAQSKMQSNAVKREDRKPVVLELNKATADALVDLPGIGDYMAGKIMTYRDRLGGFVRKEQLLEISRIDAALYAKLDPLVNADAGSVKKIDLNLADYKQLRSHPYFSHHVANSIVKMRQQKGGKFSSIEELLESQLIDRELFEKLKPYLTL